MDTIHKALLRAGTQQRLADVCGVSQPLVSQWMSGKRTPSPVAVARIYRNLSVDIRYLYPEVFDVESLTLPGLPNLGKP
ncbi:helix-turn-helix domain-containing protein [Leptospirillum sp. Group II 'CF-1']|uniref:helix-turn-helix domain-containing protein n=1 Tax=Leptospirillum sp. Group II 'CF-1' TaxID=1660083 RepID=UPI003FA5AA13